MTFYQKVTDAGFYTNANRLKFYLEEQLFKGVDLQGKRLIDVGGGNGLYGFYAVMQGAKEVVVMEPEFDGSSQGMIEGFNRIKELVGSPTNIIHVNETLQNYADRDATFDVVLMVNSINHFDEQACIDLQNDPQARKKYHAIFEIVREITRPGGSLIISDCTNRSFYPAVGLTNPLAKSIEWEKHQPPEVWAALLTEHDFVTQNISWTSPNVLGKLGQLLFSNRLAAYFTLAHFRLEMRLHE